MIGERAIDGFEAVTVADPESELEAAFVPGAGMIGCSFTHRGQELLGQRRGLAAYVADRSTMGIPLLHPWANRLGARRFRVAGLEVNLDAAASELHTDAAGMPMHGLLLAARGWRVTRTDSTAAGGMLEARLDFGSDGELLRAFPFPHEVTMSVELASPTLAITTAVRPSGDVAVPVSFGFHPYLRVPGVDRGDWEIEIPVRERLVLDERMLPTGDREAARIEPGPLGERTFDDAYVAPAPPEPVAVAGGGRRIELRLESGYPYTQVYAPSDDDVVAVEPMTAPTNALVAGGPELPLVEPGETYEATFSVTVADSAR